MWLTTSTSTKVKFFYLLFGTTLEKSSTISRLILWVSNKVGEVINKAMGSFKIAKLRKMVTNITNWSSTWGMLWGREYLNQGGWPFHFFLHGDFFQIPICVPLFIVEHGFIVSQLERWNFPKWSINPSDHLMPLKLQHTQPPFQVYFWSIFLVCHLFHTSTSRMLWHGRMHFPILWQSVHLILVPLKSETYIQTPFFNFVHN